MDVTRLIWRRWVGRHPTGVDRVCLAYLEHYAPKSQAVVHHPRSRRILDRTASNDLFELLMEPRGNARRGLVKSILRSTTRRSLDAKRRLYFNVGHTGLDDPGFTAWVRNSECRPIYLVHDLIPITHPEYCRNGEKSRHVQRMRTALSTAAGVIGNSKATLDDLSAFGRAEKLQPVPALAAWLGTTDRLALPKTERKKPDRPTFVVLGTIEARKNHMLLLQVWDRMIRRMGSQAPRLLIIGQRGWECEQVFDLLDRSETLRKGVVELGHCDDNELAGHLSSARALLFPSLVEGYGLPLIEALRAGTPVIASDLPVFREIGQGIPELLDPLDGPAWERAILSYAEEKNDRREKQLQPLAAFRAPTWHEHFSNVDSWIEQF